jgi:hypothetical protein
MQANLGLGRSVLSAEESIMATDKSLPRRGDSLFEPKPKGDLKIDLTFLKGDKYSFVIAKAFKLSGDAIIHQFETTHEWYREEAFFMPAMFCYRHYVEVILKWHLTVARTWKISTVTNDELEGHALYPLWNLAKPVVQTVWPAVSQHTLSAVERFVSDMHSLDPSGQNMRYASHLNGDHTLENAPYVVSLGHLREMMLKLWNFFEQFDVEFHAWMNQRGYDEYEATLATR